MKAVALGDHTALLLFVGFVALQRFAELALSARHAHTLLQEGAVEHGRSQLRWFVLLHAAYPVLLVGEVLFLGTHPGPLWPAWLLLFLAAQGLRLAAMFALGVFWNVRVLVVRGMHRVETGPYRVLRHPNYLAVVIELLAGPLMFGAWRTALLVSVLNLLLLRARIRIEEQALERATEARPA